MIYVFYSNDPLADDLGGGAEHFRGIYRTLRASTMPFKLVAARLQDAASPQEIDYISRGSNFLRWYLGLWWWFLRHRGGFSADDVFHFHRNYAAWPKLLLAPRKGAVMISYHNVTGHVLQHWLGRLAGPVRALMLRLERNVATRVDAIVCVSGRDRQALRTAVAAEPFAAAKVIPAALDDRLFAAAGAAPPPPELARHLLILGRISHQKNIPLAIAVTEALAAAGDDFTLTIAGRGEGAPDLIRRIAQSPASTRIRWLGGVPHDQVPALMAEHGIVLLTSRYEASPTVVKEALRAMRPVVATDVGDVADWLDEDATGWVRPPDPEALADAIRQAAALVREGRYRHTERMQQLDEGRIMGELVDLYRSLATRWADAS